ncbi:MAG TPA: hypothetical protein VD833_23025 [Vicinamibacterales bacterium]|nr:hypothetical protein [Vicinamibacterales bacterium]
MTDIPVRGFSAWPAAAVLAAAAVFPQSSVSDRMTAETLSGLAFRGIGPSLTTGRISDIAVDPVNRSVWYVAASSGNLWKTENRGNTWTPVFDAYGSFSTGVVVVDPRDSNVVWLGTGENNNQRSVSFGDGVYKSLDAGRTWTRVGLEASEHIGEILIDPRNSNVVYVAAIGPLWSAGGDRGLYKTTDGGNTWKSVLTISPDTGVTDVAMDPKRPDVLYAAAYQRRRAVGQLIGGGPESALYKTTNGGQSWTKLTRGLPTVEMGRIGLAINWRNPGIVYALVTAQRGHGGFFRSEDGGTTWTRIGRQVPPAGGRGGRGGRGGPPATPPSPCAPLSGPVLTTPPPGLESGEPASVAGPAGIAAAVELSTGPGQEGVQPRGGRAGGPGDDCYRGGDPGYYNEIIVDGHDPETIWSPQTQMYVSRDGGRTWRQAGFEATGMHVDHHDIVFDPADPKHFLVGNDGGLYETYDGGRTFRHFTNLPLSQFYRVAVDNARPFYTVCGGTQDNGTHCGPSRTVHRVGIRTSDWFVSGGGDGFQPRMDPDDPDIFYALSQNGALNRLDLRTGQSRPIRPRAATEPGSQTGGQSADPPSPVGRWHWDAPFIVSPHAAKRLYFAGERVYRSDSRGDDWIPVSPDLTRNLDAAAIPIMGRVWPRDSVAFNQATTTLSTITALDESPLLEGLLYAGTDDGVIQVTEDGGRTWREVESFPELPGHVYVTDVFASPRDVNLVFATFNNYQRGDFKPYVYRSQDRGRSWSSIAGNLPERSGAWSIVQDHENGQLLFAGLEFGVYVTVDGGARWTRLKGGIPVIQARDLHIQRRESDLVVGTFGRGVYILDDYSPLRALTPEALTASAELLPLRDAYQYNELNQQRAAWGNESTPNPPYGAVFTYIVGQAHAPSPADAKLVLSIMDDAGRPVRKLDLTSTAGLHRVAWDLRGEPPPTPPAGAPLAGAGGGRGGGRGGPPQGPVLPPARYRATLGLQSGDLVTPIGQTQVFQVVPLPR